MRTAITTPFYIELCGIFINIEFELQNFWDLGFSKKLTTNARCFRIFCSRIVECYFALSVVLKITRFSIFKNNVSFRIKYYNKDFFRIVELLSFHVFEFSNFQNIIILFKVYDPFFIHFSEQKRSKWNKIMYVTRKKSAVMKASFKKQLVYCIINNY